MTKTVFITGASRGIGRAIALKFAQEIQANIIIAAKTTKPHPTLEGTIYSVAEEVEALGARALPIALDVRDDEQITQAFAEVADTYGKLDVLINNASAIHLANTAD
ncbi:MAG TPA: short chain dehydrogenase, partial [Legionellales bacterium]|nr:short chain dehydrogenase [Legionellales bacterium]